MSFHFREMCLFRWHCLSIKSHRYQWCRNRTHLWQSDTSILRKFSQNMNISAAPGPKEGRRRKEPHLTGISHTTLCQNLAPWVPAMPARGKLWPPSPGAGWEAAEPLYLIQHPDSQGEGKFKKPWPGKKWCPHVMCLKDLQWHCYLGSTASKLATLL